MKKRIANKILNIHGFHWHWYARNGLISLAPIHPNLYYKACKRLHQKPYYDREWLNNIKQWRSYERN